MAIFPQLKFDPVVQQNDQLRFDASKTVIAKPDTDAIIDVIEIAPDGVTFVEVKSTGQTLNRKEWYLDWVYTATDGVVNPIVRFTSTDARILTETYDLNVITKVDDALLTDDNDLITEEHDILSWLPEGKSSFTYIHRRSKQRILSWIEEQGHRDCYGNKYTFDDILDREEFKEWSRFLSLRLIFGFIYNARGDVYLDKYNEYSKKEATSRNRMFKFDYTGTGTDLGEIDSLRVDTSVLKRG